MKLSKNRQKLIEKFDLDKSYEAIEAIKLLKEHAYVKFDESFEIAINFTFEGISFLILFKLSVIINKIFLKLFQLFLTYCNHKNLLQI